MRAVVWVWAIAAGLAFSAAAPRAWAFGRPKLEGPKVPIEERHSLLHSHNDYEQAHPLWDALSQRFESVEADVYLADGTLLVSHSGTSFTGSLEELYLEPLQKIVDRDGRVHADGKPFTLWIDIKESKEDVIPVLHELLSRYPMLSVFTDSAIESRAVTVVLTGNARNKNRYVTRYAERRATRDADAVSLGDGQADSRWLWYALPWQSISGWNGWGPMPEADRRKFRDAIRQAHAMGRKVRVYGAPNAETYWNEALAAGLDLIGTDRLPELRDFVSTER